MGFQSLTIRWCCKWDNMKRTLIWKRLVNPWNCWDIHDSEQEYGGNRMSPDGTGAAVSSTVVDYCVDHGVNTHNVVVIAADSTSANTGNEEGSMAHMQSLLGRTLQWNVCLLHHVHLPMKKLFLELGIETKSGPEGDPTWTIIGEEMSTNLWERPIAKYQPIDCCIEELSAEQLRRLSSDAQYTLHISHMFGCDESSVICLPKLTFLSDPTEFPENLIKRRIGKMDNSRWFTTATRVIRLYTNTEAPGHPVLNKLANYVKTLCAHYNVTKCYKELRVTPTHFISQFILHPKNANKKTLTKNANEKFGVPLSLRDL
eukprot:sb/3466990/